MVNPDTGASKTVEIYALKEPATGSIRYIGKAVDSRHRLRGHVRDCRRRNYPVYQWMRALIEQRKLPLLEVLETVEIAEWPAAERRLIAVSRARGDQLLNLAAGGNQPYASKEQRTKSAHALNEQLRNDPLMAKIRRLKCAIGTALRHGYVTNATRAKLRDAAKKRPDLFGIYEGLPDA